MSRQATLELTMKLHSDAIFGSGYSIPGGEDVAVCQDESGYPYLKGTTFKGLLRESLENWLAWTDKPAADADAILGESGWAGVADGRRLHLTDLTLSDAAKQKIAPEECFDTRVFTSLQDGVVTAGTLRAAACICRGLEFTGELVCADEDVKLLQNALRGIKWAGTMRSRGFGRICVEGKPIAQVVHLPALPATGCIHYRLRSVTPVLMTDLSRSRGNAYETRGYLAGGAIRGMVIGTLAQENPTWFAAHKLALLSEQTRFLDAVPNPTQLPALPAIKGYYEDKAETRFESVVIDGAFTPGLKRAKLGTFCALDGDIIRHWRAKSGGVTRIQRNVKSETGDTRPFQTRYLDAGQEFEGYILLEDATLAPELSKAFSPTVWLGADRYEGFGKCSVTTLEATAAPKWAECYGCREQKEIGETVYLLALSQLTMLDDCGNPCGLDEEKLAELLGVRTAKIEFCSTSMSEYGGYNRAWECRAPSMRMYDRGSIFRIVCDRAPELAKLQAVERRGLGIRKAEGCGQILFFSAARFERLRKQPTEEENGTATTSRAAEIRQKKYQWVEDYEQVLRSGKLSKSQLGSIQTLCEKAIANRGDTQELLGFLEKNKNERGAAHGSRFEQIAGFVNQVVSSPLSQTLDVDCDDSVTARLELLCLLFNYSRKGAKKEGD